MNRQQAFSTTQDDFQEGDVANLGHWIGEALGEGIAEGMRASMANVGAEFAPLVEIILDMLRQDALARGAALLGVAEPRFVEKPSEADEQLAAIAREEAAHACEEEGCGEPSVARNLCRRHYHRRLYQERRERLGGTGFRVVPSPSYPVGGSPVAAEKKPLSPVGPIIRRKSVGGPELAAAPAPVPGPVLVKSLPQSELNPSPMAAAAAAAGVTVENVARFLLGGK